MGEIRAGAIFGPVGCDFDRNRTGIPLFGALRVGGTRSVAQAIQKVGDLAVAGDVHDSI